MASGIQISALPTAQSLTGQEIVPLVATGHVSGVSNQVNTVITINDATPINPFVPGETVYLNAVAGNLGAVLNGQGSNVVSVGGLSGAWTITINTDTSAMPAYSGGGLLTCTVGIQLRQLLLAAGLFNPTFQSGNLQYTGPNGLLAASDHFIVGTAIPNPGGTPGPCALWGSFGGAGSPTTFWHIQDEAFDLLTPGNNHGWTAGEVQPNSTQNGGYTWKIGGAADLGTGGTDTDQGGTSARGPGGMKVSLGGNNTDGTHPPGDNFTIAGEVGSQGANTHITGTIINGIPGVIHLVRFNSTFVVDAFSDGRIYCYGSNGFGTPIAPFISRGSTPGEAAGWGGAADGLVTGTRSGAPTSVTIVNGLITGWT